MAGHVSDAVIRRLPGYYRHLRELEAAGVTSISSQELGERMHLTPSQIRQDINCFGGFGRQGYGYKVSELKGHIGEILGLTKEHQVIILGAGNIGCAVARYPTFSREGFKTIAMFDVTEDKVGTRMGDIPVYHMDELEKFLAAHPVDIAVLALPKRYAQDTLQRLYDSGVRAIWNFAPTDLQHPDDMLVVNVHLMDSLQQLSYRMAHRENAE
ncbi:MAG: redox-sensing transcriptional repressor Rex [Clostridia bacterium]|nr:redox-sensing transcriptional repressor Rex [Clostridia bacterium]